MHKLYHTNQNSSSPSRLHAPLVRVTRKHPCPVCGRGDWCSVSLDGERAICMRVAGDRRTRNGGHLHFLNDSLPTVRPQPAPVRIPQDPPRADANHLDGVYCTLLRGHLVLSETHRAALLARGLDAEAIEHGGYRSVPTPEQGAAHAQALAVHGLEGVPGFFREANRWRVAARDAGFYVPVRDESLRVSGLQIRRDDASDGRGKYLWLSSANRPGGTSSGAPVHYAKPHLLRDAREVLISEGALKADVIAHFLDCPVIAAAGVSNFGQDFAANLREKFPLLRTAIIAFDSDWRTKPQVKDALLRLQRECTRAGFAVVIRTWPAQHKGLDDYLCARTRASRDRGRAA
ncbi:MAG: DUF3854 domain-containing protein [Acidobacteriota bacterium]|nr:DUF3854 domain-containing protein [Acidobacteriota bacterium]